MKTKIKVKRRRKTLNKWYIFIILVVILIFISTSYALWSTKLYINGTVIGEKKEPELPVEIPSLGTDSNGVDRVTDSSGSSFSLYGVEMLRVTSEKCDGNKITTTITQIYKQWILSSTLTININLSLPNNSSYDFTDGQIEQITDETYDPNSVISNMSGTITETIASGSTGTVTVSGTMKGDSTIAANTCYSYAISYMVNGVRSYCYYKIIFIPYS